MRAFFSLAALFVLSSVTFASPLQPRGGEHHRLQTIATFPPDIAPENLVVRQNGKILMTSSNQNKLYEIDPTKKSEPKVIHTFEGVTSLTGIVEVQKDVFVIPIGNFSFSTFNSTAGSYSVWKVDLTCKTPKVSKIIGIPELNLPNGVTYVSNDYVLISDSRLGAIFRVNIRTGKYRRVDSGDPLMQPQADSHIHFGINGIQRSQTEKSELVFCDTDLSLIGKIKYDRAAQPIGKATKVADAYCDDLYPASNGNIYVASGPNITTIHPSGRESYFTFSNLTENQIRLTAIKPGRTNPFKSTLFGTVITYATGPEGNTGSIIAVDGY